MIARAIGPYPQVCFSFRMPMVRLVHVLLTLLPLGSCVVYEPAAIDLATWTASAPPLPAGALSFADAVAFAWRHHPDLARLAAEARAAGADVPATELEATWEGADEMVAVMVDPLALLRLGQRGAMVDVATARQAEALQALAVARWQLAARIAEVYAAATALAEVETPAFAQDPEPFVRAGLASPVAAATARGAVAMAAAEREALATDRLLLLSELRQLLGLPARTPLTLAPVDPAFPRMPAADEASLRRRPDLVLAVARYEVADAEFRSAVAEQYPSLRLGPDIPLRGGALDAMAVLRLPIGAGSRAVAARERRTAARAEVQTNLLAAGNEAEAAQQRAHAAALRATASSTAAAASASALRAAEATLVVDGEAFDQVAERAQMALREAMERREAVVAAARAKVQQAVAWGWPTAEDTP